MGSMAEILLHNSMILDGDGAHSENGHCWSHHQDQEHQRWTISKVLKGFLGSEEIPRKLRNLGENRKSNVCDWWHRHPLWSWSCTTGFEPLSLKCKTASDQIISFWGEGGNLCAETGLVSTFHIRNIETVGKNGVSGREDRNVHLCPTSEYYTQVTNGPFLKWMECKITKLHLWWECTSSIIFRATSGLLILASSLKFKFQTCAFQLFFHMSGPSRQIAEGTSSSKIGTSIRVELCSKEICWRFNLGTKLGVGSPRRSE